MLNFTHLSMILKYYNIIIYIVQTIIMYFFLLIIFKGF